MSNQFAASIHAQIRGEFDGFVDESVNVVRGYNFNQYDTIKRIHLYLNSQFENTAVYLKRRKLFFNITKFRCETATRMLNFDTKDLRLVAENFESSMGAFLLTKEFQQWLKGSAFSRTLNDIAENLPRYGSFVLKKTAKGASKVDLRRFAMDPTVERIWDSPFTVEKHYMTASKVRRKSGWDEAAKKKLLSTQPTVIEKPSYEDEKVVSRSGSANYYEVYERYGECPLSWITKDEKDCDTIVPAMFVTANSGDYFSDESGVVEKGIILAAHRWYKERWPYWDFHYFKTEGRWLGVGVIEDLFMAQERENEMANQKRIAMEISSLQLFQTNAQTILQNLLTDMRNGDVIRIPGEGTISTINTQMRDLSAFNSEEQRYDQLADRLSFAYDAMRGESIGKSTPATNAVLQNQAASGVYDFKKENIGIDLRFFLLEWVLPQLKKDLTPQHILRFTGSLAEMRKLDDAIVEAMTRQTLIDRLLNGTIVTNEDKQTVMDQIRVQLQKRGAERWVNVAQGFYDNVEADFDFIVTNEQKDIQTLSSNLFTILSAIAGNPAMLQIPVVKSMIKKYAEMIGIPAVELDFAEADEADIENRAGAGALPSGNGQMQALMQGAAGASAPAAPQMMAQ